MLPGAGPHQRHHLCGRFQHLVASRKKTVVALTAIARELAGFLWAAARTVDGLPVPIRPDPKATPTAKARTPVLHPRTTREYVLRAEKRFSKTPAAKTRT